MVVPAVADALGVPERSGISRRDAVVAALADGACLLVIDNCEHVLAGARAGIVDLLGACPGVHVLATSRTRLLTSGETVFAVPGLSVDGAGAGPGDAVELFAARAADAGMRTGLTDDDVAAARAICQRLDGMALAIELAAARVCSFGLDGVHRALIDGHEFLELGHATDERHGSLRAAIDWSYHLLDDEQRELLRAVSVFAAPFGLDAAVAVTGWRAGGADRRARPPRRLEPGRPAAGATDALPGPGDDPPVRRRTRHRARRARRDPRPPPHLVHGRAGRPGRARPRRRRLVRRGGPGHGRRPRRPRVGDHRDRGRHQAPPPRSPS